MQQAYLEGHYKSCPIVISSYCQEGSDYVALKEAPTTEARILKLKYNKLSLMVCHTLKYMENKRGDVCQNYSNFQKIIFRSTARPNLMSLEFTQHTLAHVK
jgi:phosphorylcholine metabolism protein LicD